MITIFILVNLAAFMVGVFRQKPPKFITPKRLTDLMKDYFRKIRKQSAAFWERMAD